MPPSSFRVVYESVDEKQHARERRGMTIDPQVDRLGQDHEIDEEQYVVHREPDEAQRAPEQDRKPALEIGAKQEHRARKARGDRDDEQDDLERFHAIYGFLIRKASA